MIKFNVLSVAWSSHFYNNYYTVHKITSYIVHTQEVNGWCEENSYERLRKAMTVAMKRLAAEMGRQ